jgi:CubicO group peptidase (beta-lactamase class C family)
MKLWISVLFGLAFVAASHSKASDRLASPRDARLAPVREKVTALVTSGRLASASVAVLLNGKLVWKESIGFADVARHIPANADTRYGLASLGKSITATAAMRLVEARRLSLDSSITRYLGPRPFSYATCERTPTIRQLLNMTGGVPHGAATYRGVAPPSTAAIDPNRAVLAFCPGEVYYYSNYSIAFVDAVIERVAHRPFGDYLAASVFRPLGMSSAALGTPAGYATPALRYLQDGSAVGPVETLPRSSRGLNASLNDLIRYARFQMGDPVTPSARILTPASLREMHYRGSGLPGAVLALGWGAIKLPSGRQMLITNGNDMGVQSAIFIIPQEHLAAIMLTNSSGDQADTLTTAMLDAILPGISADFEKLTSGNGGGAPTSAPAAWKTAWKGRWRGSVWTPNGLLPALLDVGQDGAATLQLGSSPAFRLDDVDEEFGLILGHGRGFLPMEERSDGPHRISCHFRLDGDTLRGFLTANFSNAHGKFEIPAPIKLSRVAPASG